MVWIMCPVACWRVRLIRAEGPCWKGEVQIGPVVIGWDRKPATGEAGDTRE